LKEPLRVFLSKKVGVSANQFLYNSKERQDEFSLGWYDYGARMYNPNIGRWNGVDALADSFLTVSPFSYVINNPISNIDPDGNRVIVQIVGDGNRYVNYEYRDGQLYDEAGKVYEGDNSYLIQVRDDLAKLEEIEGVDCLVKELVASDLKHKIRHPYNEGHLDNSNRALSVEDSENGIPTGSITKYDPENWIAGDNGSPDPTRRSPVAALAHELSHAYDRDTGNNLPGNAPNTTISMKEIRAVNVENKVRAATGVDEKRTTYNGMEIPTRYLEK
jgi:RHS repeat-associated protein